jgi:two-component system, sensor histidine kinase YesM
MLTSKKIFKKSMVTKYLLAFICIIVIPIFIIGVVMNNIYIHILLKKTADRYFQLLEQNGRVIEEEIKRMSLLTSTIAHNAELVQLFIQYKETDHPGLKLAYSKKIDAVLNYILNYTSQVDSMIFFYKRLGYYYYKNYPIIDENEIRNLKWYQSALNQRGRINVLPFLRNFTYNPNDLNFVSLTMGIPAEYYESEVELLYASFRLNFFDDVWYNKNNNVLQEIWVIDSAGNILLSNSKHYIGKNVKTFDYIPDVMDQKTNQIIIKNKNVKMLLLSYSIDKTDWKIISFIDYKNITREIDQFYTLEKVIFTFLILLFLVFSVIFFKNIIIPIQNLMRKMLQVEQGNFKVKIDHLGFDEIFSLNQAFNNMVKKMDKLTREKLTAEIQALQFQINPHFISNTLNSIRLMALMSKADNIKRMTEALMKFLLEVFSGKGRLIRIKSELQNLENYLYIMKVRFGDKFDVVYQIEPDVLDLYILKIILQPIMENAILHGISEKKEKGKIELKAYKAHENLIFEVIDDGIGMAAELIEKVLDDSYINENRFDKSIGIINVDKRIKLYHGAQYGLKIESEFGQFTKVSFILPVIDEDELDV